LEIFSLVFKKKGGRGIVKGHVFLKETAETFELEITQPLKSTKMMRNSLLKLITAFRKSLSEDGAFSSLLEIIARFGSVHFIFYFYFFLLL